MRDVVLKHLTSQDHRSKILTLIEKQSKGNLDSTVTKQLSYLVKDQIKFDNQLQARNYISQLGAKSLKKLKSSREVFITKKFDAPRGEGVIQIKVSGDFLAFNKGSLYTVHFCHFYRVILNVV